jgi:hypothetical protein
VACFDQQRAVVTDAQPPRPVIVLELQARESGRVHQRDKLVLPAPRRIRGRRVRETEAQRAVAGDAPLGQSRQCLARLGREAFYGIAVERDDAGHACILAKPHRGERDGHEGRRKSLTAKDPKGLRPPRPARPAVTPSFAGMALLAVKLFLLLPLRPARSWR